MSAPEACRAGAVGCAFCWGAEGAAERGPKASASARGQTDSAGRCSDTYGGAAWAGGAAGTGVGANKLLSAVVAAGRSALLARAAPFGSSKLFTRPINSCG